MARQDGQETRVRLLEAATQVFAENGYRGTTIAHICKAAATNVAAVNYHFGSKEGLYAEVWRQAFEKSLEVYPPDGGMSPSASAHDRLRVLIRSHVYRVLDTGSLGHAGQILLMEMFNPTEAIQEVMQDALKPVVQLTFGLIRELLGPEASEQQVGFCAMSVVHQCFAFSHRRCKHSPASELLQMDNLADVMAEHIMVFSLAGIKGIRKNLVKKQAKITTEKSV